jgi:hypothetical protein
MGFGTHEDGNTCRCATVLILATNPVYSLLLTDSLALFFFTSKSVLYKLIQAQVYIFLSVKMCRQKCLVFRGNNVISRSSITYFIHSHMRGGQPCRNYKNV